VVAANAMATRSPGVVTVRFRLTKTQEAFFKEHQLQPGAFAQAAVDKEIQRMQFREAMDRVRKNPIKLDQPAVDIIREERDRGN
jgi:hypothetical protein